MRVGFVTLFRELIEGYFSASILGRAVEQGHLEIEYHNPRDFTQDRHQKVDAPMVGGGAGMLMSVQPLYDLFDALKAKSPQAHIVFLSPVGKPFSNNDAKRFAQKEHLVLVSGRYEGIDERVIERYAHEVISIGDYVLTGGELASLVVCDAMSRHIDGVLGNSESLSEESFEEDLLEAPSFAKPLEFRGDCVISEYSKGNHGKITDLKRELALCKTSFFRPDLIKKV